MRSAVRRDLIAVAILPMRLPRTPSSTVSGRRVLPVRPKALILSSARILRYRQQRARSHDSGWVRAAHSVVCYRRETRRDSTRLGRVSFSEWSLAGMCCDHWHNSFHAAIIALGRAKHHGRMGSVCFPIVHLSRSPRAKPKVHFSHFRHGCSPCATPMFGE